ncbi:hypothetical protein GW758_04275 [Candidatus Falkowbacteria bacterium]|nr:hypothetical protein [Candidatus Falkowbacteria bacterium]NCT55138.1 hypothetical protein [Candidatus Falkowbacteria bacterium]
MKTKAEFSAELYNKAKADLKTKRLIVELIAGIPIAVMLSAWMFYSKLEIFFVLNYFPLFVLIFLWLYLGWNQKTFTKISQSKIEKRVGELLISTEKELTDFIEDREADIELAEEDIWLCKHELELLKEIKI